MTLNEVQLDCTGYALAVGTINGYRRFAVDAKGRLRGIHQREHIWKPGTNVAKCRARRHDAYCVRAFTLSGACKCPLSNKPALHNPDCPCGFYAFLDCAETRYGSPKGFIVGGIIEGYGKTVVGTKGFRCEKAHALCIVVGPWARLRNRGLVRLLRRNYPDLRLAFSKRRTARRYGVSLKLAQSPATDPNFWGGDQ